MSGIANRLIEANHRDTVKNGAVRWLGVTHLGGSAVTCVWFEGEAKTTIVMKNTTRWDGNALVGPRAERLGGVADRLVKTYHGDTVKDGTVGRLGVA